MKERLIITMGFLLLIVITPIILVTRLVLFCTIVVPFLSFVIFGHYDILFCLMVVPKLKTAKIRYEGTFFRSLPVKYTVEIENPLYEILFFDILKGETTAEDEHNDTTLCFLRTKINN